MEGLGKIPYVNGWLVFTATGFLLFLGAMYYPPFMQLLTSLASAVPAPFQNNMIFIVLLLSSIVTVLLKILDAPKHLYRGGAAASQKRLFEKRYEAKGYSKGRADYIYGATVGKVKRERQRGRR